MWDEGQRKSIMWEDDTSKGNIWRMRKRWAYNTRCDNDQTTNNLGRMRRPVSDSTIPDEIDTKPYGTYHKFNVNVKCVEDWTLRSLSFSPGADMAVSGKVAVVERVVTGKYSVPHNSELERVTGNVPVSHTHGLGLNCCFGADRPRQRT
jgi:hypothetical protein